ncbi:hypothetical protein K469DRAFT_581364 [Zopfia rhizophila CBS 207.26]|uniref:Sld7 C-terminal domain-containing protein n=1 Tax=Zopfia rhizophila CBS 207.26 TaxID=1314779 RepID=A0A6A6DYT7_9PEZI|nr:hypothetical protein K469DRAFT_581364 [Zopfia rhizophila CBS 207.26]
MAGIWSGNIVLPDGNAIKEITLASHNVASSPAIPNSIFRYLSTVDTARIPLYLAAGPSLDVWTTSEDTEQWFYSVLSKATNQADAPEDASRQEWWRRTRSQSPIGVLVQVVEQRMEAKLPRITDILFYGTIAAPTNPGLPTPPTSSPAFPHLAPNDIPELRVHALPLSSDLLHASRFPDFPNLSPPADAHEFVVNNEFQFIPSPLVFGAAASGSSKRKRDIFDEATQLRRKAGKRGGEGVAAAAAKAGEMKPALTHRKSLSVDTKAEPLSDTRPGSANGAPSRPPSRLHSRSPSISFDARPLSRKGLIDGPGKRSSLSQVATVPLQPEEPTIETRNKESLTRVVMAAMRMYGLQQRKKSRRGSVAPSVDLNEHISDERAAEESAKDEEYKLIYHQTFKGAVLALRKHISTKPLHSQPDRLRDVVEKLLAIFCNDPLTEPLLSEEPANLLSTPGSQKVLGGPGSTHSQASSFDVARGVVGSAKKIIDEQQIQINSPCMKRKER